MIKKTWTSVRNRGARPLKDGGLLLGSSVLPIRLRSFGKQHSVDNCVVEDAQGEMIALGSQASALRGRAPRGLVVKRPFREGRVEDLDSSRILLERLLSDSRHGVVFGPRLVVGIASHLSPLERRTVEEVVKAAGARDVSLVECCILSLIGHGRDPLSVQGHLVVDLGAGHGEVALVSSGKVQSLRTVHNIGNRLDQAIVGALHQELSLEIAPEQAEELKIELGTALPPAEERRVPVTGCDATTGLPCSKEVGNAMIYEAIKPILLEIAAEIRQVLKMSPSGFISDIAKHHAVLVGGVAKLPGLKEFLEEETKVVYDVDHDPASVTSRGLDIVLHDPKVRRRLLLGQDLHGKLQRNHRPVAEKLVGLLAVALILLASYFPSDQAGRSAYDFWNDKVTSMYGHLSPPPAAAATHQDSAERAELERRLGEMEKDNQKLRKLAKLESSPPPWASDSLSASVIARPATTWNSELLVDAGLNQGVSPGMVVTTAHGLLGRVGRVEKANSRVKLIGEDSEAVGGRIKRTSTSGLVHPNSKGRYTLTYIDPNDGVQLGDVVETSGLDGLYPSGVPLGKVVRLIRTTGDPFLSAEIEGAVELDKVETVVMIGQRD